MRLVQHAPPLVRCAQGLVQCAQRLVCAALSLFHAWRYVIEGAMPSPRRDRASPHPIPRTGVFVKGGGGANGPVRKASGRAGVRRAPVGATLLVSFSRLMTVLM